MAKGSCETVVAPLLLEITRLVDKMVLSIPEAKALISFTLDQVEDVEGDISSASMLLDNRCSVCFTVMDDEDEEIGEDVEVKEGKGKLISYRDYKESPSEDSDLLVLQRKAYENCFGEVMVAGCVCKACAASLPDADEEDLC